MLFSTNFRTESIFLKYLCQFLTEWSEVAVAAFDGHFHQSQVAVKFLVVLNGKVLISITRGNLIQELGEVTNVALLMGLEVGGDEDDTLVWQSVTPFGIVPKTDIEMNTYTAIWSSGYF